MTPKKSIIPIFIPHAGCRHACVFCNQHRISNAAGIATPDIVRAAYASLAGEGGENRYSAPMLPPRHTQLAFYGGSFTAIPPEQQNDLLEAAQPFLRLGPHNSIRVSTRPDCIDDPTVARLKGYGVKTIELGAQSMCDDVLARSRRGHTSADVARAAETIKSAGLELILQMMTGLPGDDGDESRCTAKRFIELEPDGVRIYPTVVVRGTALFELWQGGQYKEHSLEDAVKLCAEIAAMFRNAEIPVIRIGLNPTEALTAGDAAAGAYHPALGEMVYSKLYFDKAAALLKDVAPGSNISITVSKGRISMMIGHKRKNIRALTEDFSLKSVKVVEADVAHGEIRIEIIP